MVACQSEKTKQKKTCRLLCIKAEADGRGARFPRAILYIIRTRMYAVVYFVLRVLYVLCVHLVPLTARGLLLIVVRTYHLQDLPGIVLRTAPIPGTGILQHT